MIFIVNLEPAFSFSPLFLIADVKIVSSCTVDTAFFGTPSHPSVS